MLKYKNKLNRLNDRALTILETGQVLWVTPETESPLLIDLNNEFTFHWITCTSSLTESLTRLTQWYMESPNDGPATGLVITQIENGMNALMAPSIERFVKLMLVVADAAAKFSGAEYVKTIFELMDLLGKIESTWKLGKPVLAPLNELLPILELLMEQMMLASLYFEMSVNSLTRNAFNTCETVSIMNLKAPIIGRIRKLRADVETHTGYIQSRFRSPEEGFWPPGLRGDVADVVWR